MACSEGFGVCAGAGIGDDTSKSLSQVKLGSDTLLSASQLLGGRKKNLGSRQAGQLTGSPCRSLVIWSPEQCAAEISCPVLGRQMWWWLPKELLLWNCIKHLLWDSREPAEESWSASWAHYSYSGMICNYCRTLESAYCPRNLSCTSWIEGLLLMSTRLHL